MIEIDVEQRSDEWFDVRGTIPTASKFDKIITPTGKASTQAATYMNELLAYWLMGRREDSEGDVSTPWMQRGEEMEAEAIACYEMRLNVDVTPVGFCLADNRFMGCSPDGFVGDRRGLEIKCPKASTHCGYLLGQTVPRKYWPQIQGSLLVTGRETWDFMSYHPNMEPLLLRVQRDVEYIQLMDQLLSKFISNMMNKRIELTDMGYKDAA